MRNCLIAMVLLAANQALAEPMPTRSYPASINCTDELVRMSKCDLLDLYRRAEPGPIPSGYTPGRNIPNPGGVLTGLRSRLTRATVWQGKFFNGDGTMTNRMFGVRTNSALISVGESWIDGKPSIILDYQDTALLFAPYRDEMREVSPGIYLGVMHKRGCPEPKLITFFAIDARCCK